MWFAIVPTVVLAAIAQFVMLNLLSHLIPDGHSEIRKYIAFIPLIGAVLGTVTCVTKIVAVAGLLWLAVTLMDGSAANWSVPKCRYRSQLICSTGQSFFNTLSARKSVQFLVFGHRVLWSFVPR